MGRSTLWVNVPEFDLNDPFTLNVESGGLTGTELQDARNKMWRNRCINDTYEPGSTFKIITAAAGLEAGVSIWMTGSPARASGSWKTGKSGVTK